MQQVVDHCRSRAGQLEITGNVLRPLRWASAEHLSPGQWRLLDAAIQDGRVCETPSQGQDRPGSTSDPLAVSLCEAGLLCRLVQPGRPLEPCAYVPTAWGDVVWKQALRRTQREAMRSARPNALPRLGSG